MALLAAFALWQSRAASPLLPPRVVLDRNRGGAFLAVLIAGAGMFGIFLFLIYYMQQTLGYSPVVSGVAFLPMIAMVVVVVSANLSNVVLLPRLGRAGSSQPKHATLQMGPVAPRSGSVIAASFDDQ